MKLHEDRNSFLALLNQIHDRSGVRLDILEKDYYVTLMLKELSGKQENLPAYFKGGTALYKAQKSIRRFSEDIDLTVDVDNCSNNQAKKRLEQAAKKYTSLPRTSDKELEDDRKGSITTVYDYEPVVSVDDYDPLQRFRHVKVEATSFTVSEPFMTLSVEPELFTLADTEQKQILIAKYEVEPFPLKTIRLERIFADKIFAAEFYYNREMYFDVAKHIYDVSVMMGLEQIQDLMNDSEKFIQMISYKRLEETRRTGSDLDTRQFKAFEIFDGIPSSTALLKEYNKMQESYIFNTNDRLPIEFVERQWNTLRDVLENLK